MALLSLLAVQSEGAALHAAILAGQEALAKGKHKHEVAAVIESQAIGTSAGFDPRRGSHSRRSSACGSASHAIAGGGND